MVIFAQTLKSVPWPDATLAGYDDEYKVPELLERRSGNYSLKTGGDLYGALRKLADGCTQESRRDERLSASDEDHFPSRPGSE